MDYLMLLLVIKGPYIPKTSTFSLNGKLQGFFSGLLQVLSSVFIAEVLIYEVLTYESLNIIPCCR